MPKPKTSSNRRRLIRKEIEKIIEQAMFEAQSGLVFGFQDWGRLRFRTKRFAQRALVKSFRIEPRQ